MHTSEPGLCYLHVCSVCTIVGVDMMNLLLSGIVRFHVLKCWIIRDINNSVLTDRSREMSDHSLNNV